MATKASPLANQFAGGGSLVGWLYRSTRFAALNHLRDDRRHRVHEKQAMQQFATNAETAPDWDRLRLVLDEAMADLNDEDREALLLRFFKRHDLHAVGAALGVSDDTAQKRVSRALEKLRQQLARRGITSSAIALSAVIMANAVQAAPAGLAATISSTALLTGTAFTCTVAATKAIAMTTLQKTLMTGTITLVIGAGIYETRQASTLRGQVQTLEQQQAPLAEQILQSQRERDDATRQLAALRDDNERLGRSTAELLRLRGELARLRREANESPAPKPTNNGLSTSDPNWKPNWIALRPFNLAQFPDSKTSIACSQAMDVGTATPAALLQTWIWAQRASDAAGLLKTWDFPEGTTEEQKLERVKATQSNEEYVRQNPDGISVPMESKLRDLFSLGDDYYLAFIDNKGQTTGTWVGHQMFRRVGDEWKVSLGRSAKQHQP
ncbi:MAG: sigma-70 family RNA polymerase sigma factor [Verrucomicrobia bacterium]|nr:sigma-70 family RNA polymerase sigma factor [Verrucomicrobiota bacterium]